MAIALAPFARYSRYVNVVFDRGHFRDWSFRILLGVRRPPFNKGAGYRGGCTFYVTWRCVDGQNNYRPRKLLQVGVTGNAHRVPWTRR